MLAIQKNGNALEFVKKQTPVRCMAAVKQNPNTITDVNKELRAQVKAALEKENKPKASGPKM